MGRRWETPERLSTRLSSRAEKASCSTTSRMYLGTRSSSVRGPFQPGFLRGDFEALLDGGGIMGADFAADAVFQRRDDLAARRVVFRIGGEDQHHVDRQAHGVAFNLDIAFLHDVEQADLNFAGEIRQFVDGEDAAVGARQQAVVHRELIADVLPAARGFDRVDIADHVGDGDIGRGQFFDVALFGSEIADGRVVAHFLDQLLARLY